MCWSDLNWKIVIVDALSELGSTHHQQSHQNLCGCISGSEFKSNFSLTQDERKGYDIIGTMSWRICATQKVSGRILPEMQNEFRENVLWSWSHSWVVGRIHFCMLCKMNNTGVLLCLLTSVVFNFKFKSNSDWSQSERRDMLLLKNLRHGDFVPFRECENRLKIPLQEMPHELIREFSLELGYISLICW